MSTWNFAEDNDEEEDEETTSGATRDSIIFLVDASEAMFEKNDDESHFHLCIKCALSVVTNKIISSDKDLVGVVLFGTDKSRNKHDFKHIFALQDLEQPSAVRILELESFLSESFKYGHNSSFSLNDALWCCSNMFSQCSKTLGHKRILLFTNCDNPHAGNVAFQRQAKTRASDLNSNGIGIELMSLKLPSKAFDISKFYQDIIFAPDDEDLGVLPDPSEKFDELLMRVRTKDHKKRTQGRLNLSLGEGVDIGVSVYNLVTTTRKPVSVKLYKRTNEEIRTKSSHFSEETGEQLMPSDIKKFQVYGGRKIVFEQDELQEMKKFGDSGLALMGFKSKSSIKSYFHIKHSQFLFPDENSVKGSTTAFCALLQKCIERNTVAICRHIARKNSPPRFVALLPQDEELDENNVQITPPGFHLVPLPYADDLRKLSFQEMSKANPEQVDKAKEVIKKLQFQFTPGLFENPDVQTFWRNLEALALDRSAPDEFMDYTAPNIDRINTRAGKLINEFKEMVYPDGYTPGAKAAPKRKPVGEGGANKRMKADNMVEIDVEQCVKEGKLSKLTVAVLKTFCQSNGLSATGKKNELLDKVKHFFGV